MGPNDADEMANSVDPDQTAPQGMANSVDPDQTAPLGAVWSGSALFAQAYLSENLGSLRYLVHIFSPVTDNCSSWISGRNRMAVGIISWPNSPKECCHGVRIEPATVRIPGGRAPDRAPAPGIHNNYIQKYVILR